MVGARNHLKLSLCSGVLLQIQGARRHGDGWALAHNMVANTMFDRAGHKTNANNLQELQHNLLVLDRNLGKQSRRRGGRHQWQTNITIHRHKEMMSEADVKLVISQAISSEDRPVDSRKCEAPVKCRQGERDCAHSPTQNSLTFSGRK